MLKTVVLGMDGSPDAARAMPYALELAGQDGRIVAVHVREMLMGRAGGQTLAGNEDEIEANVRRQVEEMTSHGISAGLTVISAVAGGPAHVLADVARKEHADVIVVGTRGHNPVAGLLIGSVTNRLLHISPCPVLAVPPAAADKHSKPMAESASAGQAG